jgi:hypothetical protein
LTALEAKMGAIGNVGMNPVGPATAPLWMESRRKSLFGARN